MSGRAKRLWKTVVSMFKDYLRVLTLGEQGGSRYGIAGAVWVAEGVEGLMSLEDRPQWFLPILEQPLGVTTDQVAASAAGYRLSIPEFPLAEVVRIGLRSPLGYWQSLALRRAQELGDIGGVIDDVERLANEGASQQVRHLARRFARTRKLT